MTNKEFSIRDLEIVQSKFLRDLSLDQPPEKIMAHLKSELVELTESLKSGDNQEIASEIADCVIFLTTLSLQRGIDLSRAIEKKLERNFVKYNPIHHQELVSNGLSPEKALLKQKKSWNGNDKKFT